MRQKPRNEGSRLNVETRLLIPHRPIAWGAYPLCPDAPSRQGRLRAGGRAGKKSIPATRRARPCRSIRRPHRNSFQENPPPVGHTLDADRAQGAQPQSMCRPPNGRERVATGAREAFLTGAPGRRTSAHPCSRPYSVPSLNERARAWLDLNCAIGPQGRWRPALELRPLILAGARTDPRGWGPWHSGPPTGCRAGPPGENFYVSDRRAGQVRSWFSTAIESNDLSPRPF